MMLNRVPDSGRDPGPNVLVVVVVEVTGREVGNGGGGGGVNADTETDELMTAVFELNVEVEVGEEMD